MKFFEPDGGTATPEAQMWLGIVGTILCLGLDVNGLFNHAKPLDKIGWASSLILTPMLAYHAWKGYRRKDSK